MFLLSPAECYSCYLYIECFVPLILGLTKNIESIGPARGHHQIRSMTVQPSLGHLSFFLEKLVTVYPQMSCSLKSSSVVHDESTYHFMTSIFVVVIFNLSSSSIEVFQHTFSSFLSGSLVWVVRKATGVSIFL